MKKITRLLMMLSIVLISGISNAQFSNVWLTQYKHTHDPGFSNEGRKIAEDANGNIFMLADVVSDLDPIGVYSPVPYHYVTLTKYSTLGAKIASVNINVKNHIVVGFNNFNAFGLEIDAAGNVYVGYAKINGGLTFDIGMDKYDNSLAVQWSNTYTMNGTGGGVDMKYQTSSNSLIAVVKSTQQNTTTYHVIKSVPSNSPATLVYAYLGNSAPVINSLALDNGNLAYVAGYRIKSNNKNVYVAAINTSTNSLLWSTSYSLTAVSGDNVANKITVGVDGKIYTVGYSHQLGAAGDQVLILRNTPGNPRFDFSKVLSVSQPNNRGLLVNATENGWLYIGSATQTVVTLFRIPSNGVFTSPAKIQYTPVPSSIYNSVTGVTLNAMKVSTAKNIYITGGIMASGPQGNFSSSYMIKTSVVFGSALVRTGSIASEGEFDKNLEGVDLSLDYAKADIYWLRNYWDDTHQDEYIELIDLNAPTPFRESNSTIGQLQFTISPNPAREFVNLTSEELINEVEVVDLTGHVVINDIIDSNHATLNTSNLSPGIYICKIRTAKGESLNRLVIQ